MRACGDTMILCQCTSARQCTRLSAHGPSRRRPSHVNAIREIVVSLAHCTGGLDTARIVRFDRRYDDQSWRYFRCCHSCQLVAPDEVSEYSYSTGKPPRLARHDSYGDNSVKYRYPVDVR